MKNKNASVDLRLKAIPNQSRKKSIFAKMKESWQLYVLVFPAVLYLFVFQLYPLYGAQIAFKKYNIALGIWQSEWIGFDHFIRFFQSYDFWRIMWNTIGLSLYELIVTFPLPIILALSLNYVRKRFFKRSVQMVTYAPHFISVVVMVGIIIQFLDPRLGVINALFEMLGLEPMNFMAKPELFKSIYVWSAVWQNTGFACIIYLAALSSVDPGQHEAAIVDGANKFQRIWHIDIPSIMPIAIILLILNTGQMLNIGYEKVLLMQNPLNISASEVIDTYVYKIGLTSQAPNFSYATAIGLFKSVVSLILLITVNNVSKRVGQQSLW